MISLEDNTPRSKRPYFLQGITYEIFQGFCKAMYLLESTLSEGVLCCSAKSLRYLFVKSLAHIFFGKIIAKAWLMIRRVELSSNNLDFDQNILMKLYHANQ